MINERTDFTQFRGTRTQRDVQQIAPLTLAYVGDTIYDLFVRTRLIDSQSLTPHGYHMAAAKCVCAAGQAAAFRRIEALLTEAELTVFKRGRNAHSGTVPKNANVADYHAASGFEALIGYLYLTGEDARLTELINGALEGAC
ncbi:MAG: ribonuclease III domain-containing protein [Clostridia bacterium]